MKRLVGAVIATVAGGLAVLWLSGLKPGADHWFANHPAPLVRPMERAIEPRGPVASLIGKKSPAPAANGVVMPAIQSPEPEHTNVFAVFSDWLDRYTTAGDEAKKEMTTEGQQLARHRADAMASLIQIAPASALEHSLSYTQRKSIPPEVAPWVEQPLNAIANYEVIGSTPANGAENSVAAVRRGLRVDGQLLEAFTYGSALEWPSRPGQAINGIVLPASASVTSLPPYPTGLRQGIAAISPNPARILDSGEASAYLKTLQAEPICGISGLPVTSQGGASIAQIGGNYASACSLAHLESQIAAGDTGAAGAAGVAPTTDLPTSATGTGLAGATVTKGTAKRYIFCRPVFPDYNGYTSDAAVMAAYVGYSNYITHTSYRQLVPQAIGTNPASGSFITPPLLLPGTVAEYEAGTADITQDIINALHTLGINLKPYQFFCIVNASKPGFNAAGLGSIGPSMGTDGGSQSWCRLMGDTKSLDPSLLGHELGHNIYLAHSHGWNTSGRSVIGPGVHDEYGDPDSLMGATWGRDSYTANLRNYLGWISGSTVQTINGPGLRRVELAELDDNTNGVRAIRIKHPNFSQYYWLEYRIGRSWMDAQEATQSIGVRWGSPNGSEAWWLPVQDDRLGANRLALGHTFSDPVGDIHITPLAIVSNSPATLEVAVAIGPFTSNSPPAALLTASRTSAATGIEIAFKVTATDPEGDDLAYGWDFGGTGVDGPVALNTNAVSHSFAAAGYYNVRCVVSDMKGGLTTESLLVKIGTPTGLTVSGNVNHPDGTPLEGIKVQVDGTHFSYTDSTGHYSITQVPNGTYSLEAADPVGDDYIFESWLPTPLLVNRTIAGANFTALDRTLTSGARAEYFADNGLTTLQAVSRAARLEFPGSGPASARSARWSGLFNAPFTGNYLFHATGNGSARILLNGAGPAANAPIGTNQEATAFIHLVEGQPCAVQVEFAATDDQPAMQLTWTTPAGGVATFTPDQLYPTLGGLRGSYYASTSLTNLAFVRIDSTVDFPSGVLPGPRLPGDNYSARWEGTVRSLNAGTYKFITTSDDGVRLWVNDRQIVNDWNAHAPKDDTGSIALAADQDYRIVLEYYQGTGGAAISLQWVPPGGLRQVIPARLLSPAYTGLWAEYYDTETLDSTLRVSRVDPSVDYNYSNGEPAPGIASTTFSGRWQGTLAAPTNGLYQFAVWADDATRLWVNGKKILDNWGFQGAVELTGSATLTTNAPIPIRLETQQIGGNYGVRLRWTPPGGTNDVIPTGLLRPQRTGLWAEYYDSTDLTGMASTAHWSAVIDEDYGANGPPAGLVAGSFSSIWRGRISGSSNTVHRIILTSAGGARLYWDDHLVIDDWNLHPKHDASFSTNMSVDAWHDLRVEYRNEVGNGFLQLSWSRAALNRQTVPSTNLLPPARTPTDANSQILAQNGAVQLRWPGLLGPIPVLTATDLKSLPTTWARDDATPFLSNGFWYLNAGSGTNGSAFFTLSPANP